MSQSDCSNHKKSVAGVTDMKLLAEMIGDLNYETLAELFLRLREKIGTDAKIDAEGNRTLLSQKLWLASSALYQAYVNILLAYAISKPFMKDKQ